MELGGDDHDDVVGGQRERLDEASLELVDGLAGGAAAACFDGCAGAPRARRGEAAEGGGRPLGGLAHLGDRPQPDDRRMATA